MPLFIDKAIKANRSYFRKEGATNLDFKHKARCRRLSMIFDPIAFKDCTLLPKNCLFIEVI